MPQKVYHIEHLDCANCAAKIESKFNAHPQVEEAVITFSTKQLRLTAQDPDALLPELTALARTVEHNVQILHRDTAHSHSCACGHHHDHDHECACGHHHDHGHECACGHHHDHGHDCACGHHHDHGHDHAHEHNGQSEKKQLLSGIALFAAALLLGQMGGPSALSFAAFVAAYFILGRQVLTAAWKNLTRGHMLDENFLMSLATIGAFLIGEFPEAVGVMLFYRVGEYFEHKAVERSRSQIMEAIDLRPETVNLVLGEEVRTIPAGDARVGDLLLVRPGDRIPLDGTVISGESRIDTAPITGEPVPVRVTPGSALTSGCLNTSGQLTLRVEKPLSESMVTRILNSVENAAASKPRVEKFITRFARVYTPIVVSVAAATAILPSVITGDWGYWVYTALTFLVMSCPCALVLSIPLAYFAGIGAGSRKGILFKGGQSMEVMTQVKAVVLDKTGTLTNGDFRVQSIVGGMPLLQLCASCEQHSTHPIAASIVSAARQQGLALLQPEELEELAGLGIRARVQGSRILCGSPKLLTDNGIPFDPIRETGTCVLVAVDGVCRGHLLIGDTLKPGAEPAVRRLRSGGLEPVMLTGDTEASARTVAGQVGIREVYASLLPHQKLETLRSLRAEKGPVMFVGDGINDAPVLAGADVGAAMGSGADAAIEAADLVFMTSDPEAIPQALDIARRTRVIAWQNVVFALGIKAAVMVLGLMGHASMWLAVFADSGVAMLCVLNSIRLLYKK